MDDHNGIVGQNQQPQTIFEAPVAEEVPSQVESPVPEEIVSAEKTIGNEPPPVVYEESKTKYFFVGGAVLFFIVLLFIIFQFIKPGSSAKQPVKLTYWGLWEDATVLDPIFQKYHKLNPNITVEYTKMSPQDSYKEKLIARSKNGGGPDIFRFHNTWLPELTQAQIVANIPSSIMSNSEFEKTFYKVQQTDLKSGDYYYGIPFYIDGLVLIYNQEMLKNVGVTQAPVTWDDIISVSQKLNPTIDSSGNLINGSIALGTASNVEHFSDILGLMLVQNGADIKHLDTQVAADALESYRFFAEGKSKLWDDHMPNSINAFVQEKVAMIIAPSWEVLTINKANPDLKIKVAPVPVVPGSKQISIANYWTEGVSRYSKQQIEAWKLLKFMSQAENLQLMYDNQSKVRLFGTPFSRVDMASKLAQNTYIGAVIRQADSFVSLPLISRTFDGKGGLNDGIVQYLLDAVNATAQGVSYAEAMRTAAQGVNQVLKQYAIQ